MMIASLVVFLFKTILLILGVVSIAYISIKAYEYIINKLLKLLYRVEYNTPTQIDTLNGKINNKTLLFVNSLDNSDIRLLHQIVTTKDDIFNKYDETMLISNIEKNIHLLTNIGKKYNYNVIVIDEFEKNRVNLSVDFKNNLLKSDDYLDNILSNFVNDINLLTIKDKCNLLLNIHDQLSLSKDEFKQFKNKYKLSKEKIKEINEINQINRKKRITTDFTVLNKKKNELNKELKNFLDNN